MGVYLLGRNARGNRVVGNFIGLDVTGRRALPNANGVFISDAPGNIIGGGTAPDGNIISGNRSVGVYLFGSEAAGNQVKKNRIGTDAGGRSRPGLGNGQYGVLLYNAPPGSGTAAGFNRENVIRGSRIANFREFTGPVPGRGGRSNRSRSARNPRGPLALTASSRTSAGARVTPRIRGALS